MRGKFDISFFHLLQLKICNPNPPLHQPFLEHLYFTFLHFFDLLHLNIINLTYRTWFKSYSGQFFFLHFPIFWPTMLKSRRHHTAYRLPDFRRVYRGCVLEPVYKLYSALLSEIWNHKNEILDERFYLKKY